MASVNKVILIGNLTRDPQTKTVGSTTVTEFGIACNRRFKAANGEDREEVTFVDVTAWSKAGDVIQKYCRKGKLLYVEGRLKLDTWDAPDGGGKRSKLSVVLEEFQFLGGREDAGSGETEPQTYTPAKPAVGNYKGANLPTRTAKPAPQDAVSDDVIFNPEDIPF
jgi:single-strand DNA-binding protein